MNFLFQMSLSALLSFLAHDLKTPLTIIQGNAELLAESADTTAPELDAILRAGDRAQQYLAALRSVPDHRRRL